MSEPTPVEALELLFKLSHDLFWIADLEGRFIQINPAWERTLGYTLEELYETRFRYLVHSNDGEAVLAELSRLGRGMETVDFECRVRCKDGRYRVIR